MSHFKIPTWLQFVLALLSGLLLTQAFAPLDIPLLAIICLATLLILWHEQIASRAFALGYVFGLGFFGVGVSWVYNSIHEFGKAPAAFAIFLTLLFVLVLSLFPAICGWLQARWRSPFKLFHYLLMTPALWLLLEWTRGWFLTGFPWLQLGYTQLSTPLAGAGPIIGVLGMSGLVMMQAGALVLIVLGRGIAVRISGAVCIIVVFILTAGLGRLEFTEPMEESLSVAMVQGNIAQKDKWEREWLLPTIERYETATLEHLDKDLIVWPEVALPGLHKMFDQHVIQPLLSDVLDSDTTLILGVLKMSDRGLHNALMSMGQAGEQVYFKRHLVAFGEFIPFRNILGWFGNLVELPADDIKPGLKPTLLQVGDIKIAGSICYEDAFGSEIIDMLPEANLLVNVSNDAWFGNSFAPHQHLQIAQMRALETGRPMIRSTNTGVSAFVDYRGQIIDRAPQFQLVVLTGDITPRTGMTPYVRFGNYTVVIAASIMVLFGILFTRRRKLQS